MCAPKFRCGRMREEAGPPGDGEVAPMRDWRPYDRPQELPLSLPHVRTRETPPGWGVFLRVGTCVGVARALRTPRSGPGGAAGPGVLTLPPRLPLPQVQLQLRVEEMQQRSAGHDLRVAVVHHEPPVVDVLPADALGPRGQHDDLRLPHVQAWGTDGASDHLCGRESALPPSGPGDPSPRRTPSCPGSLDGHQCPWREARSTPRHGSRSSAAPTGRGGDLAGCWMSGCGSESGEQSPVPGRAVKPRRTLEIPPPPPLVPWDESRILE